MNKMNYLMVMKTQIQVVVQDMVRYSSCCSWYDYVLDEMDDDDQDYFPFESKLHALAFMMLSSPRPMVKWYWAANSFMIMYTCIGRRKCAICIACASKAGPHSPWPYCG